MTWFYWFIWTVARIFVTIAYGTRVRGLDNIPRTGPLIVAGNHQSGMDPPFLGCTVPREMHFFAKKELFSVFFLGRLISWLNAFPVRRGVFDPKAMGKVFDVLSQGGGLIFFPEGTRGNGEEFLKPKPGIGMMAIRAKVPIVPAFIHRSHQLKKALWRRRGVRVWYGPPIPVEVVTSFANDRDGYQALAEEVMRHIGRLKEVAFTADP